MGGADGKRFFLRNCGFFNEMGRPGETFSRAATGTTEPDIDLESLPTE
jgi:hypothetical protein